MDSEKGNVTGNTYTPLYTNLSIIGRLRCINAQNSTCMYIDQVWQTLKYSFEMAYA